MLTIDHKHWEHKYDLHTNWSKQSFKKKASSLIKITSKLSFCFKLFNCYSGVCVFSQIPGRLPMSDCESQDFFYCQTVKRESYPPSCVVDGECWTKKSQVHTWGLFMVNFILEDRKAASSVTNCFVCWKCCGVFCYVNAFNLLVINEICFRFILLETATDNKDVNWFWALFLELIVSLFVLKQGSRSGIEMGE